MSILLIKLYDRYICIGKNIVLYISGIHWRYWNVSLMAKGGLLQLFKINGVSKVQVYFSQCSIPFTSASMNYSVCWSKQNFRRLLMYDCRIEDSFAFQTRTSINSAWLLRKMVHGTLDFYLCIFCSHLFSMHEILCHHLSINWFYLWFKGLLKLHLSNGAFSDHPNLKRCLLPLYTIDSLRHLFNMYDFAAWENHSLVLYVEVGMLDSTKWKCQVL